jgi:3-isopropylmalate/(R)-2-methylmalate dehydratase large subunit
VTSSYYRNLLDRHTLAEKVSGDRLLYVDRHYIDETCFTCFDALAARKRNVRRPDLTFAFADHTVPTSGGRRAITNSEIGTAIDRLTTDCGAHGIELFGMDSSAHGIAHVSAPEQGLTLPGHVVVGSDSHMPTHGGVGALGIGIGLSEQTHVLATQTFWHRPLKDLCIELTGQLNPFVSAKDVVLNILARIGASGAIGYAAELTGSALQRLSVEQRMTLCNMMVEGGARTAMVPPDDITFAYVEGRSRSPRGTGFEEFKAKCMALLPQAEAFYDRHEKFAADLIEPMVTWGNSPHDALPVNAAIPDPLQIADLSERERYSSSLSYMGLSPGIPLSGIPIDMVFIGSCTNGRIEDLRSAAAVLEGRRVNTRGIVVPGSQAVKQQAEREGLADIFLASGLEWRDAGCSMCAAMNGDVVKPGERCASTSNRNFRGRQGPNSRTHLMSPAMAAAAAVAGSIVDVRKLT